jgi:hypothetical protein
MDRLKAPPLQRHEVAFHSSGIPHIGLNPSLQKVGYIIAKVKEF